MRSPLAFAALLAVTSAAMALASKDCDTRAFPSDGSGLKPVSGKLEGAGGKRKRGERERGRGAPDTRGLAGISLSLLERARVPSLATTNPASPPPAMGLVVGEDAMEGIKWSVRETHARAACSKEEEKKPTARAAPPLRPPPDPNETSQKKTLPVQPFRSAPPPPSST